MSKTRDLANLADLNFDSGTMVVDKDNDRVGVGTSSPAKTLTVHGSDGVPLQLQGSGNDTAIAFAHSGTINSAINSSSDGAIEFRIGGLGSANEAARINNSGDLLVGKTASSESTAGTELNANGYALFVRDSNRVMQLNRTTSDGEILRFSKDGSTVGSIGTDGGDIVIYTAGDSGIRFNPNGTLPTNGSGTVTDNAYDLGQSSLRWQDLYLSGGVYLGGTGSANHLDDYEEGTFTPEVWDAASGGNQITVISKYGSYTKVGGLVTVHFYVYNLDKTGATAANTLYFRNLPFATRAITYQGQGVGAVRYHFINTNGGDLSALAVGGGVTYAQVWAMGDNQADYPIRVQDIMSSGVSDIEFTVTYKTP